MNDKGANMIIFKHTHRDKTWPGHDVNFCSDLPHRASEIQFSLALEKLYIIILYYFI